MKTLLLLCFISSPAFARGGGTQVGAWKCYAQGKLSNGSLSKPAYGQGMTRPSAEQSARGNCQSSAGGFADSCHIVSCQ